MKKLLILLSLICLQSSVYAGLTLVSRETFQGVGTLNTASPGNLGTVQANSGFYKRPRGPKVAGDATAQGLGWSADLHLTSGNPGGYGMHTVAVSGGTATSGVFTCWYYFDNYSSNGTRIDITGSYLGNGNQLLKLQASPVTGTFWYNRNGLWTDTDSSVAIPLRTWIELRQEWIYSGSNCTGISANMRVSGSSTWTSIYTTTTSFNPGGSVSTIKSGSVNGSGSTSGFCGRYGMPSLYTIGTWADRLLSISDVVDPAQAATSWYVNPATGSDSNDGLTSGTAWQTVAKINAESAYCGMFPASSYLTGDSLSLDTTTANLVIAGGTLSIKTAGLNFTQLGGGRTGTGEIQAWKSLANASFTLTSGTTKVYQITDSETSAVIWENDKWLTHPTGANLAAVQATLESTAGSFWTDGTIMYVHPFGDTNPTSDGKAYTRSYYRAGGNAAVEITVPNTRAVGLRVRKTCIADKSSNDPGSNYCFQGYSLFGGTNVFDNCYGDYGSKHVFGFTSDDITRQTTLSNCQAEQGSPYSSQTPWVDYTSQSATGTATTTYNNCITNSTVGLVGSTAGAASGIGGAWISHNNGSGNYQFATISFNNCVFNGGINTYGAVNTVRFNRGQCGGGVLRSPDSLVSGSLVRGALISCDQAGGSTRVRNCLLLPEQINAGSGPLPSQGTVDYQGNTLDLRATTSNANPVAMFSRSAALTMIWKNNYVIGHATIGFPILQNGVNTDSYTFTNNAYTFGAVLTVALNYNDGTTTLSRTFAQWQALGKDASSLTTTTAASIDSNYRPITGSPLISAGIDLGAGQDFTGRYSATRTTIGGIQAAPTNTVPGTR